MNRASIVFCIAIPLLISSLSVRAEEVRLEPDFVKWCLEQMSPEMRIEVGALQCILTPTEFSELLSLDYDRYRRRWIEDYWRRRDPIYTTKENEIREEHNRRVAVATSQFYRAKWPMWDQRGEVYIRYGDPVMRRTFPAQTSPAGITPAGEIWYYPEFDMWVLFEDAVGDGEFTYYLEHVNGPTASLRMEKIHPIDKLMGAVPPMASAHAMKQYEDYMKGIFRFQKVLDQTPAAYSYDFETRQQPFVFSVEAFRGGEWVDRVDVNIEFVADLSFETSHLDHKEFLATAVFWDTEGNEVGRRDQHFKLPTVRDTPETTRLVPGQIVFSLKPGFYHMAATVQELTSGKVSSYRMDVTCRDFESKLAISDVMMARAIEPATQPSPFDRGALEVVPHPSRRFSRWKSIPVYFEVYNLAADDENLASYTVEYEVVSRPEKGSGVWDLFRRDGPLIDVSSSFDVAAYGSQDVVQILLGAENLAVGEFALRIMVQDEHSRRVADREVVFNIVE